MLSLYHARSGIGMNYFFAKGWLRCLLLALCLWSLPGAAGIAYAADDPPPPVWHSVDAAGAVTVDFYFFWSETCPHCRRAKPFVRSLPERYPWLRLHSHNVTASRESGELYVRMVEHIGETSLAIPGFMLCGKIHYGFHTDATTGRMLLEEIQACRRSVLGDIPVQEQAGEGDRQRVSLPVLGEIDPEDFSLPVFTLLLAGVDAFNPCAFFVLLFLLSLLVHARSRARMLLVGGIFLFFSGAIYFVFMAAWLNLFLLLGEIRWVTLIAGIFAIAIALINIKDFFYFKRGVSLSIPEGAKPGLYQRVTGLIKVTSLPSLIAGTVLLALAVNAYELLCTAGFPMVYTRVLTLNALPQTTYYLYLLLYNVVYVLPLAAIVLIFTFTLGSRKLTEKEGRILKLLSGWMMLSLGVLLVAAPHLLNRLGTAVGLLAFAVLITGAFVAWDKRRARLSGS